MRTLLHSSPRWECPKDSPARFAETLIIYEENGRHFVVRSKTRFGLDNPLNVDQLCGNEINVESTWPAYDEFFTTATEASDTFVKKPRIGDVAITSPGTIQERILSEARVCEGIKKNPHTNLVDYRGCLVYNGKITGLVLAAYSETLSSRVGRPFDRVKVLEDIKSGIKHLHAMGFVHGDISPDNIMFDADDNAVLVDFDSAYAQGHTLLDRHKQGTPGYSRKAASAEEENDHYSIARIDEFLQRAACKLDSTVADGNWHHQ